METINLSETSNSIILPFNPSPWTQTIAIGEFDEWVFYPIMLVNTAINGSGSFAHVVSISLN